MKDPLSACDERCSMLPRRHIMSPSFDAIQLHVRVIEESMEYADRVASTADTGDHAPWQFAILLQDLSTGLSADDALEVADHRRVWMSASKPRAAQAIAVATPCCPAPVSAMILRFPIFFASSACPRVFLIIWPPPCKRSSLLR